MTFIDNFIAEAMENSETSFVSSFGAEHGRPTSQVITATLLSGERIWLMRTIPADVMEPEEVEPEQDEWGDGEPSVPQQNEEGPLLGLATTEELLNELKTRIEIDYYAGGGGLQYTTVNGRPETRSEPEDGDQQREEQNHILDDEVTLDGKLTLENNMPAYATLGLHYVGVMLDITGEERDLFQNAGGEWFYYSPRDGKYIQTVPQR